ncbi:hypothetical protein [Pseudomonas purpurea]|uniref:hypothetical protein n=1 Tax=Pseudomonas purpurea TaxID=3136737 RepID=UPI0032638C95
MLSAGQRWFFRVALWLPLVLLLGAMLGEWLDGSAQRLDTRQVVMICVFAFGPLAYLVFAVWATRSLNGRTEKQVLRSVWLAPLLFIPFYAGAWVLYGVVTLLTGDLVGFGMMVMWVVLLPYLLIAGYFISGLTVALYWTFYR